MKKSLVLSLTLIATANLFAQNVGIGESNPLQKLHVDGSPPGLQTIRVEDMGAGQAADFSQASGANIQTSSTVGKSVYVDASGDMTSRYAYGDNIQSLTLTTGTQTLSTTTLVDLTGAAITFTPRHPIVYLSFAISGYNSLAGTEAKGWAVVSVLKGATVVGSFLNMSGANDVNGQYGAATIGAGMYPITVTPGTSVTIKLQGRTVDATTDGRFTIDKANYGNYMTIFD